MALVMNASLMTPCVAPAGLSVRGRSGLTSSPSSVRFSYGFASNRIGRRALVVRAEEPSAGATSGRPTPPSSPPGLSGTEIPLGGTTRSAPLDQGAGPVGQRIAYICQQCGYVYNEETPFEEVSEDYTCPVCTAPKMNFTMSNSTVEETLDTTKSQN